MVKDAHEDILRRADMTLFLPVLGVDIAVGLVLLTAGGEPGGSAAVHRGLPDIVLVIEQHGALPLQPAGYAVGLFHHGVVVVLVPEAHAGGQNVLGTGGVVVDVPALLLIIPPDHVLRQRRHRDRGYAAFRDGSLTARAHHAHGLRVLVVPLGFHGIYGADLEVIGAIATVTLHIAHQAGVVEQAFAQAHGVGAGGIGP